MITNLLHVNYIYILYIRTTLLYIYVLYDSIYMNFVCIDTKLFLQDFHTKNWVKSLGCPEWLRAQGWVVVYDPSHNIDFLCKLASSEHETSTRNSIRTFHTQWHRMQALQNVFQILLFFLSVQYLQNLIQLGFCTVVTLCAIWNWRTTWMQHCQSRWRWKVNVIVILFFTAEP